MTGRKIGLDYVRSAAILCVLVAHTLAFYTGVQKKFSYPIGVFGVELFFVLSGYLVGGIFLKSVVAHSGVISGRLVREFWVRRWMRTVPNYLLFIVVWAFAQHVVINVGLLRFLVFGQNLVDGKYLIFFDVSWSLAVEEWFYLLLPILSLLFFQAIPRARWAVLVTVVILFIGPLLLRLTLGAGRMWDEDIRKVVVFRLDSLMWGVFTAAAERYRTAIFRRLQHPLVLIGGLALALVAARWQGMGFVRGSHDFVATRADAFIFSLYSLACAMIIPSASAIVRGPGMVDAITLRISLWSYSMYLCHIPIFWAEAWIEHRFHLTVSRPVGLLVIWTGVFAVSCLLYHAVELPVLRLRDAWTTGAKKTVPLTDTGPAAAVPS